MCTNAFSKIVVDNHRLILCRKTDLAGAKIKKLIKKAYPELFPGFKKIFKRIKFRVVECYKMYSSQFDCQIGPMEKKNDWDKYPFIALKLFEKDGTTYCSADVINI